MSTIVPSPADSRPIISSLFNVEFGQIADSNFSDVAGLSVDIEEVESLVVVDGKTVSRWTPGTVKYSEITLKREFTGNKDFWTWLDEMAKGKSLKEDGSIVMFDLDGTEVGRWNASAAWPSKWSVTDLDVGANDGMVEEITLQIEFLERIS